jgi:hypothetical protein
MTFFIFIPPGLYFFSLEQHLPQFFTLNKPVLASTATAMIRMRLVWFSLPSPGWPVPVSVRPLYTWRSSCETVQIRPRETERLYFGYHIPNPHGRRRRRHSDCGPSFSPIFHLWVNPRGLSEVATREMRRSVLLRLHLNRREHDRALLRGLDCRVHVFQASFELLDRDHIPYYKLIYYGSIGQAASGIFTGHFAVCALCRTRLTWSLAEYAHRAYNTVKVRVPTAYKSRAVKNNSAGITNKNNCRII